MYNIVFIAPPAAGKGTVSEHIKDKYNLVHISMGDILRHSKDPEIQKELKLGNLIPDSETIRILDNHFKTLDIKNGFILDGYPRDLSQAKALDEMLLKNNLDLNIVISLEVTKEKALKRILGRLTCPNCGKVYNKNNPLLAPKVDNICDICKTKLESRTDDNEKSFNHRFDIYLEDTSPLIKYYSDKGILYTVESFEDINKVFETIEEILRGVKND